MCSGDSHPAARASAKACGGVKKWAWRAIHFEAEPKEAQKEAVKAELKPRAKRKLKASEPVMLLLCIWEVTRDEQKLQGPPLLSVLHLFLAALMV